MRLPPIKHPRLTITALAAATLLATGAGHDIVPAAARKPARALARGEAVFWNGPHIKDSSSMSPRRGCDADPCWIYPVRVLQTGFRLRVGIDHPEVGDVFDVDVYGPGRERMGTFSPGDGLYSAEFLVRRPQPGLWRYRVRAQEVTDSAFRMRAKLEARRPRIGRGSKRVLPNLQILPPHDPSFLKPLTNGATGGPPQGVDMNGAESCHPEERAEDGAVKCLRFSYGIRNTGRGPMQLHFSGSSPPADQKLYQRVARADGTYFDRVAGIARWHKTHVHYHHNDAVALRLFHVTNPRRGEMKVASAKRTKGFAHRDELLREWRRFYPTLSLDGFGLSAGWSDIYEWDRPGNYIDFGLNGDGHYVVRMWADPVNGILESNEVDNLGYSYLKVTGSDVKLIEVGRGTDPWDRCKVVMGFGGHPDPPARDRPRDCPRDTT